MIIVPNNSLNWRRLKPYMKIVGSTLWSGKRAQPPRSYPRALGWKHEGSPATAHCSEAGDTRPSVFYLADMRVRDGAATICFARGTRADVAGGVSGTNPMMLIAAARLAFDRRRPNELPAI
jgi:hypothetical protein